MRVLGGWPQAGESLRREARLNNLILAMNTQLIEAKKQVALAIADEKRLGKQFETERTTSEEWERSAMRAVHAGDDALAVEALRRHRAHQALASELQAMWTGQNASVSELKEALCSLNDRIEAARQRKNMLVARMTRLEAAAAVRETLSQLREGFTLCHACAARSRGTGSRDRARGARHRCAYRATGRTD